MNKMTHAFKLHIKGAEPGGYISLKRILDSYLSKAYPGTKVRIEQDYLLIRDVDSKGKSRSQIETEIKSKVLEHIQKWKRKTLSLEEIAAEQQVRKEASLLQELQERISVLEREKEEMGRDYTSNENAYMAEIGRLEGVVSEQRKQLKTYENEDRRYIKEVDEKYKQMEKELQRARLLIMRFKRGVEHFLEDKEEQKVTKIDHVKKALEEGNSSPSQIFDYFRRNQISITSAHLSVLLSKGVNKKEIRRTGRGKYSL